MDLCFDTTPQVANACGISSDMSTNSCRCSWCISCVGNVWSEINARVRGAHARACAFAASLRRLRVAEPCNFAQILTMLSHAHKKTLFLLLMHTKKMLSMHKQENCQYL